MIIVSGLVLLIIALVLGVSVVSEWLGGAAERCGVCVWRIGGW